MVDLLVRINSWFFNGNPGVRFMTVLLQIATLVLTRLQIERRHTNIRQSALLFFIVSASLSMFAIYGFTTTPDVPLLFFTALLLYGYKSFLEQER
jgi:4-amino-4-deoxy-L-arabinose transferase-like glycosyltransferase